MNRSEGEGGSGIPILINKLCNHFAENDPGNFFDISCSYKQ